MTHFDRYRKPVVVLLDMVSVALDQLGEVVGSLAQEGQIMADDGIRAVTRR